MTHTILRLVLSHDLYADFQSFSSKRDESLARAEMVQWPVERLVVMCCMHKSATLSLPLPDVPNDHPHSVQHALKHVVKFVGKTSFFLFPFRHQRRHVQNFDL